MTELAAWWMVAGLSLAFLLWRLKIHGTRWWDQRRRDRRTRRAVRGETEATQLLEEAGFRVVDSQVRRHWPLTIDGRDEPIEVRADHIVERGRQRFVAEVKTGQVAPDPTHTATRRQLLEYLVVFDVDGILLVDMESVTVQRIEFPNLRS